MSGEEEEHKRLWDAIGRIVSDIDSEKDTRRRITEYFEKKIDRMDEKFDKRMDEITKTLRSHERLLYIGIGALAALEIVLKFVG